MASPSDRDNKPTNTQTTTDNPFIKFRQFADTQLCLLLQGLIGLPSTFSRNQTDHPRWADFDEDLRRRDELQARKREMKASEARRSEQTQYDEEHPIALRTRDLAVEGEDECGLRDVPLYSAVSQSLFSHLSGFPKDGEKPWSQIFKRNEVCSLPEDDIQPGVLRFTQYILYEQLATSLAHRSDYSLLPYLLFSPYSPIKLSASIVAQPSHENGMPALARDDFPYRQAFQDLIQTTYPQQLSPRLNWFWNILGINYLERRPDVVTEAVQNKMWIENLYLSNILQRKQLHKLNPGDCRLHKETVRDDCLGFETEQDMYQEFLQRPTRPHTAGSILDLLEDPFKHLKDDRAQPSEVVTWDEKTWGEKHTEALQEVVRYWEKLQSSTSIEPTLSSLRLDKSSKAGLSPDKLVSSSTTTEKTIDENGCVETRVTVWKRYANGRETTTTTAHMEEPPAGEDGKASQGADSILNRSGLGHASDNKTEKKGWFWN